MCIYKRSNESGYLLPPVRKNYFYVVFERKALYNYLDSFKIDNSLVDGIEETDDIDVINLNFDVLIRRERINFQNFKMVRWGEIANFFEAKLNTDNQCIVTCE